MSQINIDLTELSGWDNLEPGTYDITVGAKANGYTRIKQSAPVSVTKEEQIESYLTFSSPNSFTLSVANSYKNWDGTIETSTDKTNWITWDGTSVVSSSNDGKLYIRGIGNTVITGNTICFWNLNGSNISVIGNIETLLDYATVAQGNHPPMATHCYMSMFYNCTAMISAPELPATTMASYCYQEMFRGCSNLISAPALPAITLANNCYAYMFYGCTNLETLVALPALNLPEYCYGSMFYNCSKIKLSMSQIDNYQNLYRIPITGSSSDTYSNSLANMFVGTTGIFSGIPSINTDYYTSNAIVNPDGTITPAV